MKKKYHCAVSGEVIPDDRVAALRMLEIPEKEWTLKEHSGVKKKQAIWMGDVGRSELKIVKKIGNASLREVFNGDTTPDEPDIEIPEEALEE